MDLGTPGTTLFATPRRGLSGLTGGLIVGACGLGIALVAAGAGSGYLMLGFGALAVVGFSWLICLALDVPVIGFVRFAFIASFFFKADFNLFKVDEIEDPSGLNISLTLLTAIVLVVYDYFRNKTNERVFTTSFLLLLGGLFVCAAISVFYSGGIALSGFSLVSLLSSILIAFAVASHFSHRDRIGYLVMGIAAGVMFTGCVAFTQYTFEWPVNLPVFGTGTEDELLGTQSILFSRVPGFLRTPTGMGWVISTMVPLALAPVICQVRSFSAGQRLFMAVAAFGGVVGIILSLARGSWIGLVVAIALLVAFGWYRLAQNERRSYFVAVGGSLILALALLIPFSGRIYDRLTEDDQGAASIRIPMMENAMLMIEDNPLVGVGMSGYRANMTRYDTTGIFVSQVFPNPVHNIFAHVTAEIGIPGGIIFCLILLAAFIECLKTMTSRDRLLFALGLGTAVALIAFVISGLKEMGALGSARPPMRTGFLLLGMIFAVSRLRRIDAHQSQWRPDGI